MINPENDDRFPEDSTVLVWYPPPGANDHDGSTWAWLPGSILGRCGPNEWQVVVEAPALAEPGPYVANVDPSENLLYPVCFRDSSEIRAISEQHWDRVREALAAETQHG